MSVWRHGLRVWSAAGFFLFVLAGVMVAASTAQAATTVVYAVPDSDRARQDLAVLLIPQTLDLELVDGIVYPGFKSLFRRGDSQIYIRPGEREIAVKYNNLFQTTANDHDVVKSKVMILTFVAEPGKTYRATHANFRNAHEARAGTTNFVVTVNDDQGVNRVVAASQMQKNWKGEQIVSTRADLVSAEAQAARAAMAASATAVTPTVAVQVSSPPSPAAVPAAPAATTPATGSLNAGDLLKFSWQNATAAERAAFLDWVKLNP